MSDGELVRNEGALISHKEVFALYLLQCKRFRRSLIFIENGAPKHSKSIQNGPLGRHLVDILSFKGVLEKCELLMNFGVGKIL